jgi:RHS repeat-associated protein
VVRARYDYYPYGLMWHNPPAATDGEATHDDVHNNMEWQQGEWADAGIDMYDYPLRMYDPVLGRFHAPDPFEQGYSPYVALADNPANYVDPTGGSWACILEYMGKNKVGVLNLAVTAINGLIKLKKLKGDLKASSQRYCQEAMRAEGAGAVQNVPQAGVPGDPPKGSSQIMAVDETSNDIFKDIEKTKKELEEDEANIDTWQDKLEEIESEIEDTKRLRTICEASQYLPTRIVTEVFTTAAEAVIDKEIEDLEYDRDHIYKPQLASFILAKSNKIKYLRKRAVDLAWRIEYEDVKAGGDGVSRVWTKEEKAELIQNPKKPRIKGYQGHHIDPVSVAPEKAGDPANIVFKKGSVQQKGSEHYNEHFDENGKNKFPKPSSSKLPKIPRKK